MIAQLDVRLTVIIFTGLSICHIGSAGQWRNDISSGQENYAVKLFNGYYLTSLSSENDVFDTSTLHDLGDGEYGLEDDGFGVEISALTRENGFWNAGWGLFYSQSEEDIYNANFEFPEHSGYVELRLQKATPKQQPNSYKYMIATGLGTAFSEASDTIGTERTLAMNIRGSIGAVFTGKRRWSLEGGYYVWDDFASLTSEGDYFSVNMWFEF